MLSTTVYPASSGILPLGLRPQMHRASQKWWIEQDGNEFLVRSADGETHTVVFNGGTWACSCPDQLRGKPCKHVIAIWLHGPVTTTSTSEGNIIIVPQNIPNLNMKGESTMYANTSHGSTPTGQARPASTLVQARPASTLVQARPASTLMQARPASTPVQARPASTPVRAQPASTPVQARPAPTPVQAQPAPTPVQAQPAPTPVQTQPAPTPVQAQPAWMRDYDRSDDIGESYPYIQWVNRGSDLEPRQPVGGFAAPIDQDIQIGIYAILHHANGAATEVFYSDRLQIAVLRRRFCWIDPQTRLRLPGYQQGARSKTQFLCYVRNENGEVFGPVMLTFTGLAGAHFDSARHEFAKAVRKATGGKAPSYAFWMVIVAGQPKMVGKGDRKSAITPPVWNGDFDPDRDFLGDELLDAINWDEVDRWASPKIVVETSENNGIDEEYEYEEPGEDIPF